MPDVAAALWMSLKVSLVATLLTALLAVPLAFALARARFRGRSAIEAVLTLPLVLPPTVVGYALVVLLGRRGWIGQWLDQWFDLQLVFDWRGAVIAAGVVSFPLLLIPAKAAFASIDRELEDIARLHGANTFQIFWHVSLPLARRGIASGTLLAFARALGEFGATLMVLGDLTGRQTLPIAIYADFISGQSMDQSRWATWAAIGLLTGISLAVILFYNRISELARE